MGSGNSKQTPPPSQVWSSTTPVSFSPGLVDSLQSSTENDSIRAKTLELHVQTRVAEELKRLQGLESQKRKEILEQLSKFDASNPSSDSQADNESKNLGRESVQKEIQALKRKLEERKKLQDVDGGVEQARNSVVKCLRDHDRRPLDCYREVEIFKEEVRRLEGAWVEKVVS